LVEHPAIMRLISALNYYLFTRT